MMAEKDCGKILFDVQMQVDAGRWPYFQKLWTLSFNIQFALKITFTL